MYIEFSPPDIGNEEMLAVQKVLESGWLTTGPKTKEFEAKLAEYCGTQKVAALSSATSALEICLRLLDIGPGDEVITSAYTYTASASVVYHVGATLKLVDVSENGYHIDPQHIVDAITERTKAVIAVDYAGVLCDYDEIRRAVAQRKELFKPKAGTLQEAFSVPVIIADGAHSLGATYLGKRSGQIADFTVFSFHAVKNLVTGEGGALTWHTDLGIDSEVLYRQIMLLSLHGQTKDALTKNLAGSWEYDVVQPYYKCNMTDISAAMGIVQLKRYPELLARRHAIIKRYNQGLRAIAGGLLVPVSPISPQGAGQEFEKGIQVIDHASAISISSAHLFPVRLSGYSEVQRNRLIEFMASRGIASNVHYKPLPLLSAYRAKGFDIRHFPFAHKQYINEISLPLHTLLKNEDIDYIVESLGEFC